MPKYTAISFIILSLCFIANPAVAKVTKSKHTVKYYVGADVMMRHMNYHDRGGKGLVNKNNLGTSIYGGRYLNNYFAFEVGFDYVKNRTSSLAINKPLLNVGLLSTSLCKEEYNVIKTRQHGLHFSIVGFTDYYWDRVQLIGSLGFSALYLKAKHMIPWCTTAANMQDHTELANQHIVSKHHYTLAPRIALGLQFKINDSVKVRAQTIWEQTSKIGTMHDNHNDTWDYQLKPKNTISYSLGIIKELH